MKLGKEQYLANKRKAGASGSSKGIPRPYSKANALKARLWSPLFVGTSLTVTPKHPFKKFGRGVYYEWEITEPGFGEIEGIEVSAQEIFDHFVVKQKGKRVTSVEHTDIIGRKYEDIKKTRTDKKN